MFIQIKIHCIAKNIYSLFQIIKFRWSNHFHGHKCIKSGTDRPTNWFYKHLWKTGSLSQGFSEFQHGIIRLIFFLTPTLKPSFAFPGGFTAIHTFELVTKIVHLTLSRLYLGCQLQRLKYWTECRPGLCIKLIWLCINCQINFPNDPFAFFFQLSAVVQSWRSFWMKGEGS